MEWDLLFELIIAGICTILALGVEAWLRNHPNRIWLLVTPGVWLICLAIGSAVAKHAIGHHPILITLTYIAIAVSGCRLAFLLAPSKRSSLLVVGIIITLTLLTLFELRQPVIDYLDSFTITIGETRLSLMKLIEAGTLIVILFWVSRAVLDALANYIRRKKQLDETMREWLIKLSELSVYFLILALGLKLIGIDITTLAVFGGAIGVGLGFGLQKIISNYISGLILLFEKTVKVGDLIELEGGPLGKVNRLDPRGTFILCTDGKEVIVPNEEIITKKVTNYTFTDRKGQISIPVAVDYRSDVELAKKLLLEAASEQPFCLKNPAPKCYIREFGSYAIHFVLQFWVEDVTPSINGPQSDVMFAILRKFKDANIEIPVYQFGNEETFKVNVEKN